MNSNLKMHFKFYHIKLLRSHLRNYSTRKKNHYKSLGISSKVTQADIKTAYYKLSMLYHPDKATNKDDHDSNAKKFHDISEAYEILGNVKSRKLYDRGLYFDSGILDSDSTTTPTNKFYKSRDVRSKPPAPQGRTIVYNFDEWSKHHYGKTLLKEFEMKQRRVREIRIKEELARTYRTEQMVLLLALLFMVILSFIKTINYDEVATLKQKQKQISVNEVLKTNENPKSD